MKKKPQSLYQYYLLTILVSVLLALFIFTDKIELVYIYKQTSEIVDVLLGTNINTTSYNETLLMPHNNQTAYFISGYKSTYKPVSTFVNKNVSSGNQEYRLINTNTIYNAQYVLFDFNELDTTSSVYRNKRKENNEVFDFRAMGNFKLSSLLSRPDINRSNFTAALHESFSNEAFSTNGPFKANNDEPNPDPEEPEGFPLPLKDDLQVLFFMLFVYLLNKLYFANKKYFKQKMTKENI